MEKFIVPMTDRAFEICAKVGIEERLGINKRVFMHIFSKIASEKKILGRSR